MSAARDLEVGARRDEDEHWVIASPATGWWRAMPSAGSWIGPRQGLGILRRLKTDYRLVLPDGVQGRVVGVDTSLRVIALEHGQRLLQLVHDAPESTRDLSAGPPSPGGGIARGEFAIRAPTDGIFYRRAAPDTPPFVRVGDVVRCGQPVGLVEVMKTFHQILMEGRGAPSAGQVREIRCEDGDEVTVGQVLVVVQSDAADSAVP